MERKKKEKKMREKVNERRKKIGAIRVEKKKKTIHRLGREEHFSRRYVIFSVNGSSESIEIGKARNTKPVSTLFPRYRACGEDNERKRNSVGNGTFTRFREYLEQIDGRKTAMERNMIEETIDALQLRIFKRKIKRIEREYIRTVWKFYSLRNFINALDRRSDDRNRRMENKNFEISRTRRVNTSSSVVPSE